MYEKVIRMQNFGLTGLPAKHAGLQTILRNTLHTGTDMKPYRIIFLIGTCFLIDTTFAQPQVWEVYSTSDQPFVNVTIEGYRSDTLYMKYMNQLIVLHHDSIR